MCADGEARRLRKRRAAVYHIQRTPAYRAYRWALLWGLAAPLREPDPEELPPIPKRDWERGIQDWRRALRDIEMDAQHVFLMRSVCLSW